MTGTGAHEVRMPKLNNNDAAYVLLTWSVPDGGKAVAGEPLLEAETSKAVEEVEAEASGFVERLAEEGREYPPGALLARVHADEESLAAARDRARDAPAAAAAPAGDGPVITRPARELLDRLGIPEERVRELGVAVVRRSDVERLAPPEPQAPVADDDPPGTVFTPLTRVQRAVAETVSLSHRTVPDAYTAVRVDLTEALARARELSAEAGTLVGPAELTVAALAAQRERHPACFASLTADGSAARVVPGAQVGVTFDVGAGLFVPVVRDAGTASLGEVSRTLMRFRMAGLRGNFRASELEGANITVTLHTEPGVVFAVPVVFPGQACALALAAPQPTVVSDGTGGFRERSLVHLGAAYDHRLVNGSQITALLTGVRELLEDPVRLAEATA
ncbi:Dihydrolipoyllysine-residue succinyltransferase component of 2-oxoglutarate dehydrogenase complex [Streptomyces sp. RB5]|uniref:Dihydrolipoamide acetyltransferase component of pyruvate dehydrogenase complex n=1 Tax=Streptomyces smaragdinus TaxID=2585196 RepID=A0A7K0CBE1_9ACTN|nr:2-oxo acid dehydrogenase subunit E2 [Streptomyces smaragdinus]MQY10738.1 Dihydrolipoyllysine-residue succinyltransferase component of 2-oxoglutarate dehydrogenase complex [Streptomyces smaragdinus]